MFMRRDTFAAELSDLVASPKSLTQEEEWFQSVSQSVSQTDHESKAQSIRDRDAYADENNVMTEEEMVNATLCEDPDAADLTEEERELRLHDAYWEIRATNIMAEADKHNKNRLLSVIEIRTWLDSGHLSADDKWFCEWLLDNRCVLRVPFEFSCRVHVT